MCLVLDTINDSVSIITGTNGERGRKKERERELMARELKGNCLDFFHRALVAVAFVNISRLLDFIYVFIFVFCF